MTLRAFSVLFALSSVALGWSAALVDSILPLSTADVSIRYPHAAVCEDGSIWSCWWQEARLDYSPRAEPSRLGIFCRLFTASGRARTAPIRIAAPIIGNRLNGPLIPHVYYMTPMPDGSILLFLMMPPIGGEPWPKVWPGTTRHDPRPMTTLIVRVDCRGRVHTERADFEGGASSTVAAFDHRGTLHCLTQRSQLLYIRVDASPRGLAVREVRTIEHLAASDGEAAALDASKRTLERLHYASAKKTLACHFAGKDTLLIARVGVDRTAKFDRATETLQPDSTLATYRFHVPDLMLIDSTRVVSDQVAGVLSQGMPSRWARIQPAGNGFTFLVPTPAGTVSYELGHDGRPLAGERKAMPTLALTGLGGYVTRIIEYKRYDIYSPWVVDLFGVDTQGRVHREEVKTDSVFGRYR